MANEQNLRPFTGRSESEVREMNRRGGIASGKARLRKKRGRELMQALLAQKELDPRIVAELAASYGLSEKDITKEVAMNARQIDKAIRKADTNAFKAVQTAAGYTRDEDQGAAVSLTIHVDSQEQADKLNNIGNLG